MKRKTYMIYCIVCLVCLSTACTVQAITYENCHMIAVGRSQELQYQTGTWNPNSILHLGHLPYLYVDACTNMLVMVVLPPTPRAPNGWMNIIILRATSVHLEGATGLFFWNPYNLHYRAAKTFINADVDKVDIF